MSVEAFQVTRKPVFVIWLDVKPLGTLGAMPSSVVNVNVLLSGDRLPAASTACTRTAYEVLDAKVRNSDCVAVTVLLYTPFQTIL